MRRFLMIGAVIFAVAMPALIRAQEEGLTLEGLAEQITGLVERVVALENLYSPDAVVDDEGSCQLAIGGALFSRSTGGMHPTTIAAYMSISENQVPAGIMIASVVYTADEEIAITFGITNPLKASVVEYWNDCEFQSHSRFWEEDFSGNRTWLE